MVSGRGVTLAACLAAAMCWAAPASAQPAKSLVPVPSATAALMAARGTDTNAPILIRSFKKEAELEVWKLSRGGRYVLLKTFPICRWSGQLGPKRRQGDRQAPEGFYAVSARQMNPNSAYHLSFDLGYPNAYDRAHGGTGSYLMTHGTCSSMGCYAMTDAQISEIYALARDALAGGQRSFQFQAYPFRMTAANMARARSEEHADFWRQLKEGYDRFEATGEELAVGVADGRYSFAASRSPEREAAARERVAAEKEKVASLVADGAAAVRVTYADGGMHPSFAALNRQGVQFGAISRPETLALAGREIVLTPARKAAPLPPVNVAALRTRLDPIAASDDGGGAQLAALFSHRPLAPPAGSAAPPAVMAGSAAGIVPAALVARKLDLAALRD